MSIDTANRIINEQEEAIKELRHKVLDREDEQDLAQDKVLELKKALRRIECCDDIRVAHRIVAETLVEMAV